MTPAEELAYWTEVAADPERIRAEIFSDLNLDECLLAIEPEIDFPKGGYVLDLGCGVGRIMQPLAFKYMLTTFHGWDISQAMIDAAWRDKIPPNAYFTVGDGRGLTSPNGLGHRYTCQDEFFDSAYSMTMLQHLPPEAQRGYIEEVFRVLKPGGRFRFQWVEVGDQAPFSYPVDVGDMAGWVVAAGFTVLGTEHGLVKPGWGWATATK